MRPLTAEDPSHIGAYRLVGRLAAGGMGRVYLGRAPGGRIVAVKLVHGELARQGEFRERFAREVRASRKVGGEWTAAVLDADTEAEVPWVATKYVPGPSLESVVEDGYGPLPTASVRALGHRLALALTSIHDAGLVHRDLKPSNVLLTADGPRVIDFGIARALDTVTGGGLTRTGAVIGSPGFMSPEQVRGERVTTASDVFSLGSLLAYAATGRLPFGTSEIGLHALMFRIAQDEPDLTGVPEDLVDLIRECLAKDPAARPTVAELIDRTRTPDSDAAWLPAELLAGLADHAVRLLDTDGPEPTVLDAAAPGSTSPPTPAPAPTPADAKTPAPAPTPADAKTPAPAPTPTDPRTPAPAPPSGLKPSRARRRAAVLGTVLAVLIAAVVFVVLRPDGEKEQGAKGTGDPTASATSSASPSKSASASASPSPSGSPSASATRASTAERMPKSLVGAWEGKEKTSDGMVRTPRVRIELRAGARGQPLAVYSRLGYFSLCRARSSLRSIDGNSITLGEARWEDEQTVEGENREECGAPPSKQTIRLLAEDESVEWTGDGSSLELFRAATGGSPIPEEFLGRWEFVDLEGNRMGRFLTIEQSAVGGEIVTRNNFAPGCEYTQTLSAVNDGIWYGPQIVGFDDDSEGEDACERGANGSMSIEPNEGGELLMWQMYDLGSEPGTLVRARPADAGH
ncbi:serine/threonine-protein kinase [Streptomyces ipomoeae]|nr:serine/threonine-protein kinase [Streptomyces ipomoeae]MDX2880443.1 serine/threonine-protein kinase [Streptomyces ipomoeae]